MSIQFFFLIINVLLFVYIFSKDIMVNLYQLYFSSSHFLSQLNKKVFHPSIFPPFQPNTNEGKLNFFYPPTFPPSHHFLSFRFFTPPPKRTLRVTFFFLDSGPFLSLNYFYFNNCQCNLKGHLLLSWLLTVPFLELFQSFSV